jgi:hypothetical protein
VEILPITPPPISTGPSYNLRFPEVIRLGYYFDETSGVAPAATTHLAAAHYLESWGDARTIDGTVVPVQPMILPLFGGLTQIEVLARLAGADKVDGYDLVTATVTGLAGAGATAEKTMARFPARRPVGRFGLSPGQRPI